MDSVQKVEKAMREFVEVEKKICRNLEKICKEVEELKETYLEYHKGMLSEYLKHEQTEQIK
jgi:hypothetical protein